VEAICGGFFCIVSEVWAVHRRQPVILCRELSEVRRRSTSLWIDKLQLVCLVQDEWSARFGTDAYPVERRRQCPGTVRLDGNIEAAGLERLNEGGVDLQQRLATGQHGHLLVRCTQPCGTHGVGERFRRGERGAADEVRVTEPTDRACPIFL